ncbi:MAG: class I poly(R)-hydroxyalkanoic acid synthase [Betaproteobacteria bacterium]|nr:class I poly(R)-hydroxyalkanoic acid synthase [Betaproteobacteria bacterium]
MTKHNTQDPNWQELGKAWQDLGQRWLHFWLPGPSAVPASAQVPIPEKNLGNGVQMLPGMLPTWSGMGPPAGIEIAAWQELCARYQQRLTELWQSVAQQQTGEAGAAVAQAEDGDRRFHGSEWREYPFFDLVKQAYLINAEFWNEAAERLATDPDTKRKLAFFVRQYVDAVAPSNFLATNPEALRLALASDGKSLTQGLSNLADDLRRGRIAMSDDKAFSVGRNLAVTPGAVVFRNDLIEIIQYTPSTEKVHARPLLIIPPCINKYYILDLQAENSFVRYAVSRGFSVFLVSWRNVPKSMAHLGFEDYLESGIFPAIDVTKAISGSTTISTLGFCVGGALLSCALAVLAVRGDKSVSSVTLLTTMLDYSEPGEIGVYVDEDYLKVREPALLSGGRVAGSELATAFASLRANDLVWSFVVNNYLKGRTPAAFDLLYWNGDSANLPGPMYVFYLRNMYLENRLREPGGITLCGVPIDLARVRQPAYVLATREDHIVPWRAAYRSALLLGGQQRFVLGASGHIAGVINPASKNKRNYWIGGSLPETPDAWEQAAREVPGSWWPDWAEWLTERSARLVAAPKLLGNKAYPPIEAAPGRYVIEKPD